MPKENKDKKEKKHFFRDFKVELKKVIWPTPKQLINNTVAVITIVIITAIIVFALDFTFEKLNNYGINNLKKIIKTDDEVSDDLEIDNEEDITSNEEETTSEEQNLQEEIEQ